jgi:hypothetical protein
VITREQAKIIAQEELNRSSAGEDLLIIDEYIEFDEGWVFAYQTKEYVETGNEDLVLYGNGPIIVAKENGKVFRGGTAYDIEHYIEEFKQYLHSSQ